MTRKILCESRLLSRSTHNLQASINTVDNRGRGDCEAKNSPLRIGVPSNPASRLEDEMLEAKRQAVWYGGKERIDYAVDLAIRHKQLGIKYSDPEFKTDLVSLHRSDAARNAQDGNVDREGSTGVRVDAHRGHGTSQSSATFRRTNTRRRKKEYRRTSGTVRQ